MSALKWLEQWYAEQCDGVWEELYGITIQTLDNPGWDVTIQLIGTKYEAQMPRSDPPDCGRTTQSFEWKYGRAVVGGVPHRKS